VSRQTTLSDLLSHEGDAARVAAQVNRLAGNTGRRPHPSVGDIWYRVDGSPIGEEADTDFELNWEEWQVAKVTPHGAWFRCLTRPYKTYSKLRFADALSSRKLHRTKREALESLVARKRRHLAILEWQRHGAEQTKALASAALKAEKAGQAVPA